VGVVIQPHSITTGGGTAKTETSAQIGVVAGNLLKRLCTVGWMLTALIALALYADNPELAQDPDKTWGLASRDLLGPGFTGLMLACLLAALMSSIDAYMIVGSALMVRNIYAPYVNPKATERQYVALGRIASAIIVVGSVIISLFMMDVFAQLQLTWVVMMLFAAPFWVGAFWRRATTAAAWSTVACSTLLFFVIPWLAPRLWPELRIQPSLTAATDTLVTVDRRAASPSDVKRRQAALAVWETAYGDLANADRKVGEAFAADPPGNRSTADTNAGLEQTLPSADQLMQQSAALAQLADAKAKLEKLGAKPTAVRLGETIEQTSTTGGVAIFWTGGLQPADTLHGTPAIASPQPVGQPQELSNQLTRIVQRYGSDVRFRGKGSFNLELLPYQWLGIDLSTKSNAMLMTLQLPPKTLIPFIVMISVSLLTRRNSREALDRYYAKMKTPVDPDPAVDAANLARSYKDPSRLEDRKLFPGTDFEFQRPTTRDIAGVLLSFVACFAIIGLAIWVSSIGAGYGTVKE